MEDKKLILEDLDRATGKAVLTMESVRHSLGVCQEDLDRALDKIELARLTFLRAIGAARV